jgi:two-component system, OmpR family, sensor kinase
MLAALVRNLIDNAIRHIPKGGRIDVGVYREGTRAILQVEDDGPGIPENELSRIFEPFVRGRAAVAEGSGLGLSIARRIVERLNGSLALQNIGVPTATGLRVIVNLPSVDHPTQEPASAPSA